MKRRLALCCMTAFMLGVLPGARVSQGETLRDAVETIIETHPQIQSNIYNRLARRQEIRQARGGYFPEVGLNAWSGIREYDEPFDDTLEPWEFKLSLRQNVFRGFQDINEVDRQKERVNSQGYVIQSTVEDTALEAARVFIEVLRNQEFVVLARENLKIHQQIADQIRLRSESGVDRKADMNQIETRLALAQSNLVVAEVNMEDARTTYQKVVGRMPEDLVKPSVPQEAIPATLGEATEKALRRHPTLMQAKADLAARKEQEEVANAPFWPIVDIEVDKRWSDELERGFNEETDELTALLRVRYNFFKGWRDRARKVETTYLVSEAREVRNNSHRQVVELMRLAWMANKVADDRRAYLEKRVESSTQAANAYSKQWNIGRRTLLDVLDAEAERIDAKRELIDSEFDGLFADYRILNAMGDLVHTLELEWPEEAYVENEDMQQDEDDKQM